MSEVSKAKSELCDATAAFSECKSKCTEDRRDIKLDREAANAVIMRELSAIRAPLKAMHLESGKIVKIHTTTSSRALSDAKIAAAAEAITEAQINEHLEAGEAATVAEATALAFCNNIKAECLSRTSAPKIVSKLTGSSALPRKATRAVENAVQNLEAIKDRQRKTKDKMDAATDRYEACKERTEPVISAHMAATNVTEVAVEPELELEPEREPSAADGAFQGQVAAGPAPNVASDAFPPPEADSEVHSPQSAGAKSLKTWDQASTTSTTICSQVGKRPKHKKPTVQKFADDMVRMIGALEIPSIEHVCSRMGRRTIKEMGAQRLAEMTTKTDPIERLVVVNK